MLRFCGKGFKQKRFQDCYLVRSVNTKSESTKKNSWITKKTEEDIQKDKELDKKLITKKKRNIN